MFIPDPKQHPTLAYAHRWSTDMLQQMRQALAPLEGTDVVMAAASGSLGRYEGMDHSDCDLIVLVNNDAAQDSSRSHKAMEMVWSALEPLGMPLPKSSGIYATAASPAQIGDRSSLGLVADDKDIFGKRLQLLLDACPVFGEDVHQTVMQDLLERYATGFLEYDSGKEWVCLMNDLIRYLRSYCVWHQFDLSTDPIDSWYMRNLKLRHSRLLMFAALMLLLGECSREKNDKQGWLLRHLGKTPLERLQFVFERYRETGFNEILDAYEQFMLKMSDPDFRQKLVTAGPVSLSDLHHNPLPEYRHMHQNSTQILRQLTRFTLNRDGDWSESFFEYLLF